MIKLWLHTVTFSFHKCFILSACYRLCNIRHLSLVADLSSSVTGDAAQSRASVFLYVSHKTLKTKGGGGESSFSSVFFFKV